MSEPQRHVWTPPTSSLLKWLGLPALALVGGFVLRGMGGGVLVNGISLGLIFAGGALLALGIWGLVGGSNKLIADGEGIVLDNVRIGWDEIDSINTFQVGNQNVVGIEPHDGDAVMGKLPRKRRLIAMGMQTEGAPPLGIPQAVLNEPTKVVRDKMRALQARAGQAR